MMSGHVSARHLIMPVTFRLPGQPDVTLEFVVDTGFTGLLALPSSAVALMQLPFLHRIPAQLADGSFVEVTVHSAAILWKDSEAEARVLATGERPMLGTALLEGSELMAQFREGDWLQ